MSIFRFVSASSLAAMLLVTSIPGSVHAASPALNCAFAKQKAAVKKTAALLSCDRKALAAQTPIDPACVAAADARFASSFQKIEARGGCAPAGDVAVIEFFVDRCAEELEFELQGVCTEVGAPCGQEAPPCCTGVVCSGRIGQTPTCRG